MRVRGFLSSQPVVNWLNSQSSMDNRSRFPLLMAALMATASFAVSLEPQAALAAGKKAVRRAAPAAGGGGGGVVLQTPEPRTPTEHNNRGVELGMKGLWPDAIREHEVALSEDPNNKEFRTNLSGAQLRYGMILAGRKDYYNAMKQLRGALYVDPNNSPAEEQLDACLKATGKNPDNLKVRQGMAEDADSSQDYETSIVEWRKCVKMADDGPNHYQLGCVLKKAGKVVDAYSELKLAVGKTWDAKDKNDLAACHRQLADILKEYAYKAKESGRGTVGLTRLSNAGIEYRRAVTVNDADADAVRSLIEVAREAVAIRPSFDNHLMLAGAYLLGSDFDRAKMEYEECWKLNPNSNDLAKGRRAYYLRVCKSPLASPAQLNSTLQKVYDSLQKTPSDAELLYIFGRGKETQGDREAALDAYQRAAAINAYVYPDLQQRIRAVGGAGTEVATAQTPGQKPAPGKPPAAQKDDTAKSLIAYGEIEKKMREGDYDGAQKQLMAIVEKNPKEGRAWLLLGNTHEKKGDLDQAEVAYRQASYLKEPDADSALRQINSSRIQPYMKQAEDAINEKNWVAAASSLREAASLAPNLPIVHRKLSEVLRQLGDNKEADRELKKATELDK